MALLLLHVAHSLLLPWLTSISTPTPQWSHYPLTQSTTKLTNSAILLNRSWTNSEEDTRDRMESKSGATRLHSQKWSRECPILERRAFPRQHSHKDWCFTAHQEHPFKDITPQWPPCTNGHPNTTFSSASDGNCSIYILLLHRVYWTKSMATHELLSK